MKRFISLAVLFAVMCGPANADSAGIRASVVDTLADEDFQAYEIFAVLDLPWSWHNEATRIQSQLELTGGVLDAAGETGLLGTLGPRVALVMDRLSFDVGVGVAALGETEFGRHMSDADIHDDGEDLNLFLLELSYDYLVR